MFDHENQNKFRFIWDFQSWRVEFGIALGHSFCNKNIVCVFFSLERKKSQRLFYENKKL